MDKPEGLTSFAVVRRVRGLLGGVRCGHVGSLDPFATGLLPVCVGRATRLARFIAAGRKEYRAVVRFGQATDTDDGTGEPVGDPAPPPTEAALRKALPHFLGEIEQRPPAYSAKRVAGKRAYRLARAGRPVELAPAQVRVDALELLDYDGEHATICCETGPGVYIRALARDLGERGGSAAHLASLRRTAVGPFRVEDASPLPDADDDGEKLAGRLLDPLTALDGMPWLALSPAEAHLLGHGRTVPFSEGDTAPEEEVRAATALDAATGAPGLVAVVQAGPGGWRPTVVWNISPGGKE